LLAVVEKTYDKQQKNLRLEKSGWMEQTISQGDLFCRKGVGKQLIITN